MPTHLKQLRAQTRAELRLLKSQGLLQSEIAARKGMSQQLVSWYVKLTPGEVGKLCPCCMKPFKRVKAV